MQTYSTKYPCPSHIDWYTIREVCGSVVLLVSMLALAVILPLLSK